MRGGPGIHPMGAAIAQPHLLLFFLGALQHLITTLHHIYAE